MDIASGKALREPIPREIADVEERLTAQQQRDLTSAVKRARILALLPFVNPEG